MSKEYKTVCDKCGRKTWYEIEQQCHCSYPKQETCNACGHTVEDYDNVIRCTGTLRIIDNSALDERFTRYHDTGERVEVEWKKGFEDFTGYGCRTEGKKARFYVGKSTGRKPIYLQILRKNSSGGSAILSCAIKSVRGLGIYKN